MKQFIITKNNKKSDAQPDYNIMIKIGEKFTSIGGAWLRENSKGNKFFSCKLSNSYKERKGFYLAEDAVSEEINKEEIPF